MRDSECQSSVSSSRNLESMFFYAEVKRDQNETKTGVTELETDRLPARDLSTRIIRELSFRTDSRARTVLKTRLDSSAVDLQLKYLS